MRTLAVSLSWAILGLGVTLATPGLALPGNIALNKAYAPGSKIFESPQNAFDGDPSTSSGGGNDKTGGGAVAVDFGSAKSVLRLKVTFSDPNRPAQKYKIQVSDDGTTWTDFLRVWNPTAPTDERELPAGEHRYLRYVAMLDHAYAGDGESSWTLAPVGELEVFERGTGDAAGTPIVYATALDRTGWNATSTVGSAALAISNPDQGWFDPHGGGFYAPEDFLTHTSLNVGDWIQIDMGSPKTFNRIYFAHEHGIFENLDVLVSDDAASWGNPIASQSLVDNGGYRMPVSFPVQTKRYVKLVTRHAAGWWGARNLSFADTTGTSEDEAGDGVNLALHKPTAGSNVNADLLFDGDTETLVKAGIVVVDLGAVYPIGKIHLRTAPYNVGVWYTIETSDDGTAWALKQKVFNETLNEKIHDAVVFANYSARFLRFNFPKVSSGNSSDYHEWSEIEVFKRAAVNELPLDTSVPVIAAGGAVGGPAGGGGMSAGAGMLGAGGNVANGGSFLGDKPGSSGGSGSSAASPSGISPVGCSCRAATAPGGPRRVGAWASLLLLAAVGRRHRGNARKRVLC